MGWVSGQAYSEDLRARVVSAVDRGGRVYEIAPLFEVSVLSCCRFHGHRVKVDQGTGDWRWDGDGLTELSSSRR